MAVRRPTNLFRPSSDDLDEKGDEAQIAEVVI